MSLGTIEDLERLWSADLCRKKHEILFRRFSPVSTYEPDPKREEWRGFDDCYGCPHFRWRFWGFNHGRKQFISQCLIREDERVPLGDPSFCRFTEYRRILFRNFRSES